MPGDPIERILERMEKLEKELLQHSAAIGELRRRVDGIERLMGEIHELRNTLIRLEGRLDVMLARMATWQNIVWALLSVIVGGLIAAGFKLFEAGP